MQDFVAEINPGNKNRFDVAENWRGKFFPRGKLLINFKFDWVIPINKFDWINVDLTVLSEGSPNSNCFVKIIAPSGDTISCQKKNKYANINKYS